MSFRRFSIFAAVALLIQVFFVLGGSVLLLGPSRGQNFRNSVLLSIYSPFIDCVINAGGFTGEASMIWPPVFGVLLGIVVYSLAFGLLAALLTRKTSRRT